MDGVLLDVVRDALSELAKPSERTRLWLSSGASGTEVSSFEECVCRLFDDSGLVLSLDKGESVFGPKVDEDLRQLRQVLRKVEANRPPQQVLDDPLIAEAGDRAAAILSAIRR